MLKKTPRALISVLDSEGKITGYELEVHVTFEAMSKEEEEQARYFTTKVAREDLSDEEVRALLGNSEEVMAGAFKESQTQIAQLQSECAKIPGLESEIRSLLAQTTTASERADAAERKLRDVGVVLAR